MGAEGLLEPMRYRDKHDTQHYACPYGCLEEQVDFRSIGGMRGHIRQVHWRGHEGFTCDWCGSYTTKNKDALMLKSAGKSMNFWSRVTLVL